jgi:two-component system, OmpR family, KDP operon response regulator KdpE
VHEELTARGGKILLIENDPAVLRILQATMEYGGFTSEHALSASDALYLLTSKSFASVLLDHLPDMEGRQLIQEIRRRTDIPIIMVSGRDDERMKVQALDAGADDFVPKPFPPEELLARIRAALRRHKVAVDSSQFKETEPARTTYRRIPLRAMEEKLLTFLRIHEGELATSEDIIKHIWDAKKTRTERNLRVLVYMLRHKLKMQELPFEIVNNHGRGYCIRRIGDRPQSSREGHASLATPSQ